MSGRSWSKDVQLSSPGLLLGVVSWVSTLIGTNPALSAMRGAGGVTGGDSGAGVANSGPSFVSSITKTANAGEYLVTFTDGYRAMWHAEATMYGPAAGPNDGKGAAVSLASNEGAGNTTPLTVLVTGVTAAGVPEELADRRISLFVVLKNSGSGS